MADLGKRYATALFDISAEQGMLEQFLAQALFLREALQEEECKVFILHPRVTGAEKVDFFNRIFTEHIHADFMGFLHLTVTKNREAFLIPALNQLVDMIQAHHNKTTAKVKSAVALSDIQLTSMTALLTRKLGKQVDIQVIVDPAVVGGLSIQVDGFYVDRTLRFLLRNMKDEMKQTVKKENGT
jgi:F-type H+-transporting ATPase subunit delta